MGQALYRKYRPKSFAEIVGQDHITTTLQNAIKEGKISHAYLFTGPRGVGKTSVARILAHEVNGLDYKDESVHLDIIEIDAASNRRIDEIRDLRDKVNIAPAAAKYKVYIIDEVHMLTKEAFNALLKTLEEPPAHCIFILATTESHKLPDTIISRTQRFEFKAVGKIQSADHLQELAKQEKIDIDRTALELLAQFGNGSFRDSISYIDQLSSTGQKVTESDVRQLLGLPAGQEVDRLMVALQSGQATEVLNQLALIEQHGVTAAALANAISSSIRAAIVAGQTDGWYRQLARDLLTISSSPRPQELLEIVLLEAAAGQTSKTDQVSSPATQKPAPVVKSKPQADISAPAPATSPKPPAQAVKTDFNLSYWPQVVDQSKSTAASIYTALRLAKPSVEDGKLILSFQFPLHQKKLNQAKNKQLIADLVKAVCGSDIAIDVVVNKEAAAKFQPSKPPKPQPAPAIASINDIFGSTEVLET